MHFYISAEDTVNAFRIAAGSSVLMLGLAASAWSADGPPQVHQSGNISYVSGGVSEEDRFALEPIARDFNVKLVFATKSGEYLSDTDVVVTSGRGRQVLEAKSEGPWFFARLPSGQYQVTVTANGQSQRRSVTVGSRGLRTVDFRWASLEGGARR